MTNADNHQYNDIIDLPHYVSTTRPRMSMIGRAAQFSPFAALTGYDAAIKETSRLTEQRFELDEDRIARLNEEIQVVMNQIDAHPEVAITYFVPDERKTGGAYASVTGHVKKIDVCEKVIVLTNKTVIPFEQIYEMSGDMFDSL